MSIIEFSFKYNRKKLYKAPVNENKQVCSHRNNLTIYLLIYVESCVSLARCSCHMISESAAVNLTTSRNLEVCTLNYFIKHLFYALMRNDENDFTVIRNIKHEHVHSNNQQVQSNRGPIHHPHSICIIFINYLHNQHNKCSLSG